MPQFLDAPQAVGSLRHRGASAALLDFARDRVRARAGGYCSGDRLPFSTRQVFVQDAVRSVARMLSFR